MRMNTNSFCVAILNFDKTLLGELKKNLVAADHEFIVINGGMKVEDLEK